MNRRLLLIAGALCALAALVLLLPVKELALHSAGWLAAQGVVGVAAYVAFYLVGTLLMFPIFPIGVVGGAVWGLGSGYLMALPPALLGSVLAVLLGASWLRRLVSAAVERRPAARAVFEAVRGNGFRAVMLSRLAPVLPFGMQNYALGAAGVGPRAMLLGTFVGMQPALLCAAWLGSLAGDLARMDDLLASKTFQTARIALLGAGGLALVILVAWLGRVARRAQSVESD